MKVLNNNKICRSKINFVRCATNFTDFITFGSHIVQHTHTSSSHTHTQQTHTLTHHACTHNTCTHIQQTHAHTSPTHTQTTPTFNKPTRSFPAVNKMQNVIVSASFVLPVFVLRSRPFIFGPRSTCGPVVLCENDTRTDTQHVRTQPK